LLDQQHGGLQRQQPPPPPTGLPQAPLHPALLWTAPGEQILEASRPVGEDSEVEGRKEAVELGGLESPADDEGRAWLAEEQVSSWFPPRPLVGVALPLGDFSRWQPADDAGGRQERVGQVDDMHKDCGEEQDEDELEHVPDGAQQAGVPAAEPGCRGCRGRFSFNMPGRALLSKLPEGCRSSTGHFSFTQPLSAQEVDHSALVLSARGVSSEGWNGGALVEDYQSLRRRIRPASGPGLMSSSLTSSAISKHLREARLSLAHRPRRPLSGPP